uniref:Uncharacterized protein n=1 Tax=Ditylenchus dipsaci TaxID=166011 RepID=A0A915E0Q9_9BILA
MQIVVGKKSSGDSTSQLNNNVPAPMEDFFGSKLFQCDSSCPVCYKLNKPLDYSPRLLVNEMTGEFKEVPAFAAHEYLDKWSLWHELPSAESKRLLASKAKKDKKLKSYVSPNHAWSAVSASSSNEASEWSGTSAIKPLR